MSYTVIDAGNGRFIKAWHGYVTVEEKALQQLKNLASMPFIYKWVASMPDAHYGAGSCIGTVMPTQGAIVPSCTGVDIGCGMMAVETTLSRSDLKFNTVDARTKIEVAVPHGRTNNGAEGDRGAWHDVPEDILALWTKNFEQEYQSFIDKHPKAEAFNTVRHLGTLGTGNHFIELTEDEQGMVWVVLHSGSRGLGNKIGQYFTNVAKELCAKWYINLPDPDLAYLPRDTEEFDDYCKAVKMAQRFAWSNREVMMDRILNALDILPEYRKQLVHCHHNYIAWENHYGQNIMVTRKGAVRAQVGDLGIIPGSMGARTYVVRGLGNPDSFCTCSHGAGRAMGRMEAKRRFTVADHIAATEGVECLKDESVLDETPAAYKSIDDVMRSQADLVEPVARLKQFVCVKGGEDKNKGRK